MVVNLSKSTLLMSEAEESMCKKGYKKRKIKKYAKLALIS